MDKVTSLCAPLYGSLKVSVTWSVSIRRFWYGRRETEVRRTIHSFTLGTDTFGENTVQKTLKIGLYKDWLHGTDKKPPPPVKLPTGFPHKVKRQRHIVCWSLVSLNFLVIGKQNECLDIKPVPSHLYQKDEVPAVDLFELSLVFLCESSTKWVQWLIDQNR